jgi:hypothetical protein
MGYGPRSIKYRKMTFIGFNRCMFMTPYMVTGFANDRKTGGGGGTCFTNLRAFTSFAIFRKRSKRVIFWTFLKAKNMRHLKHAP